MTEEEMQKMQTKERRRLTKVLKDAGTSDARLDVLLPVIDHTAWIKVKLDDVREKIKASSVVIPYDNGGGQKGLRENPAFKGYEALWKTYISGMDRILAELPKEVIEKEAEKIEEPRTVLQMVRARHMA
jgi:hypothetical protein